MVWCSLKEGNKMDDEKARLGMRGEGFIGS